MTTYLARMRTDLAHLPLLRLSPLSLCDMRTAAGSRNVAMSRGRSARLIGANAASNGWSMTTCTVASSSGTISNLGDPVPLWARKATMNSVPLYWENAVKDASDVMKSIVRLIVSPYRGCHVIHMVCAHTHAFTCTDTCKKCNARTHARTHARTRAHTRVLHHKCARAHTYIRTYLPINTHATVLSRLTHRVLYGQ